MSDDDLSDINVTRGEKALATVLAIFLLIGGLWVFYEALPRHAPEQRSGPAGTAEQRQTIRARQTAQNRLDRANRRVDTRQDAYETAREDYRTDLDAGTSTAASKRTFEAARARLDEARSDSAQAAADVRRIAPAARAAEQAVQQAETAREHDFEAAQDRAERNTFLLRLGWVLACIALAFWLFNWLRRRRSAYFVAGVAAVIAATLQALVMACDYLGDQIDWQDTGPLWIAVAGIVASLLALVGLERYLARRAPRRRVRRGQCPYCAYPVRGSHCEGCGRATVAPCATCSAERRVGTAHCGVCGAS